MPHSISQCLDACFLLPFFSSGFLSSFPILSCLWLGWEQRPSCFLSFSCAWIGASNNSISLTHLAHYSEYFFSLQRDRSASLSVVCVFALLFLLGLDYVLVVWHVLTHASRACLILSRVIG